MKTTNEILKLDNHIQKNPQWSWGSLNALKSSLILRVWDVEIEIINDEQCVLILDKDYGGTSRAGQSERTGHFNLIMQGATVHYSIITPVDEHAAQWSIKEVKQYLVKGKSGFNAVKRIGSKWYGIIGKEVSFEEFCKGNEELKVGLNDNLQ